MSLVTAASSVITQRWEYDATRSTANHSTTPYIQENVDPRVLVASPSGIGYSPYLFVTDAAATGLGLSEIGLGHVEDYPDAGRIEGRIIELEAIRSISVLLRLPGA